MINIYEYKFYYIKDILFSEQAVESFKDVKKLSKANLILNNKRLYIL